MDATELIATKRDAGRLRREQAHFLAEGAASGAIPDYQLSAWLMAAFLNGLDDEETADLTLAMADSGERLDLTGLPHPWLDKHSTGGVGDKTSLVVLPLLAACGLTVVKMSGRGLGITGGTVDKLASVPGFRMDLTPEEMKAQAAEIGVALTGQTPRLAPADRALYALRDATGTVASLPLIVSSILSKKLAGGAETVAVDVKCGSGAFLPDVESARALASMLERVGRRCGLRVLTVVTDMSQPLGRAAGNALEVREAVETLHGRGPKRFLELCGHVGGLALHAAGVASSAAHGAERAKKALASGEALTKARQWFRAQGADPGFLDDPSSLPKAPVVSEVLYHGEPGWVAEWSARVVGETVVALGGGRRQKDDAVDPAVGVVSLVQVGDRLADGTALAQVHARSEADADAAEARLRTALKRTERAVPPTPLVIP